MRAGFPWEQPGVLGREVLTGSAWRWTSSFRAARVLQVALGFPLVVGCPQVPPCAHLSPLRHVLPCTKGQSSLAGHVLPLSLLLGGWCAVGTFLLGAGRSRCCSCFSCWLLAQ